MRKLVVVEFISLDGVIQAPGDPGEDRDGGFELGGWIVPFSDDQMGQIIVDRINQAGALLLGRRTYEIWAAYWPHVGDEDPIAAKFNRIPKYVASRTLNSAEWNNSTLLTGNVVEEVAKLKEQDGGEIQLFGSSDFLQTLTANDLVDEYRLMIFPVLLGDGKRLFAEGTIPRGLKLVDTVTSSTGVTINTYERQGEVQIGRMGPA